MRWIDRFAYSNRIRGLDPAYKAGFSLAVIVLCLVVEVPWGNLALLALSVTLAVWWAGLPAGVFLRLLLAETGFLAVGVLGWPSASTPCHPPGPFRSGRCGWTSLPRRSTWQSGS